ncbi:MAG TPA: 3-phosphoshikimate 1-carboxyvinyltransferase [Acidimicrobiales bacterium]
MTEPPAGAEPADPALPDPALPDPALPGPALPDPALPDPASLDPAILDTVVVGGGSPLRGTVRTPGDKSISHRALLLAALAPGTSELRGLSDGDDVRRTEVAVGALGARVDRPEGAAGVVVVEGGRSRLRPAPGPLDLGNSGTGMRLLAGVLAGLPFRSELRGDASLSGRPMDRIAEPLSAMGATVVGRGPRHLPPLAVTGAALRGIDWTPAVPSAQVKSAILLAGLDATGETVVREAVPTRAHTEELLAAAGARVAVESWGSGRLVRLRASELSPLTLRVPGDPSQAAFWVVAGCVVPGSRIVVEGVYAGAERVGYLGVLVRMGADVRWHPGGTGGLGATDVVVRHGPPLAATTVDAAEIPSLDEIPALVVAAAVAQGTTVFRDVAELRVKESDRLHAAVALARAFGASARAEGDQLEVTGVGPGGRLHHGRFDSGGDHRMAMAAAVAGLAAGAGESELTGFGAVATSYPGFLGDLCALGGAARSSAPRVPDPARGGQRTGAEPRPGADRSVVAIDGPAGSGKSTLSRALAARLGVERLDTGAMYRAIAWAALRRGVDPADTDAVAELARSVDLEVGHDTTTVDGVDVSAAIRSAEVSRVVSVVAANPEVRRQLVARQRQWAELHPGGVVEGRDIGSVVFPGARVKVYLTATPAERARRRREEEAVDMARRDHLDSTRPASPLAVAPDARVLDTTGRSIEDVVNEVASWL